LYTSRHIIPSSKSEALVDQLLGDQALIEDHDAQELLDVLARRLGRELAE
jgi:hypothetical protein